MKKSWSDEAWVDYSYWQQNDKRVLKKINQLIQSIDRNGYDCLGKPEMLRGDLKELWSVKINEKDRLVFNIENDIIQIASCRLHYNFLDLGCSGGKSDVYGV
jgi:toxin YoeB